MYWKKVCLTNPQRVSLVLTRLCSLAMIELQLFVSAFFLRFEARITESLKDSSMEMTDGFSGGPVGQTLPLYLSEVEERAY